MSDPFSAIPDLLFVLSRDGVCLDYRAPHPDWSPMRPEQFLGKDIRETMPGDVAEALTASLARALRDSAGQVEALEYPLPVAGETRYFEFRLAACGRDRVLVITRDITARQKMEADLRSGAVARTTGRRGARSQRADRLAGHAAKRAGDCHDAHGRRLRRLDSAG